MRRNFDDMFSDFMFMLLLSWILRPADGASACGRAVCRLCVSSDPGPTAMACSDGRRNPTNIKSFGDCETSCTAHAKVRGSLRHYVRLKPYVYDTGAPVYVTRSTTGRVSTGLECFNLGDFNQFDKKDGSKWKVALGSFMSN